MAYGIFNTPPPPFKGSNASYHSTLMQLKTVFSKLCFQQTELIELNELIIKSRLKVIDDPWENTCMTVTYTWRTTCHDMWAPGFTEVSRVHHEYFVNYNLVPSLFLSGNEVDGIPLWPMFNRVKMNYKGDYGNSFLPVQLSSVKSWRNIQVLMWGNIVRCKVHQSTCCPVLCLSLIINSYWLTDTFSTLRVTHQKWSLTDRSSAARISFRFFVNLFCWSWRNFRWFSVPISFYFIQSNF